MSAKASKRRRETGQKLRERLATPLRLFDAADEAMEDVLGEMERSMRSSMNRVKHVRKLRRAGQPLPAAPASLADTRCLIRRKTTKVTSPRGAVEQHVITTNEKSGAKTVSVSRFLGDRGRVVVMERDANGVETTTDTLHNLEEKERDSFDRQWSEANGGGGGGGIPAGDAAFLLAQPDNLGAARRGKHARG